LGESEFLWGLKLTNNAAAANSSGPSRIRLLSSAFRDSTAAMSEFFLALVALFI